MTCCNEADAAALSLLQKTILANGSHHSVYLLDYALFSYTVIFACLSDFFMSILSKLPPGD